MSAKYPAAANMQMSH